MRYRFWKPIGSHERHGGIPVSELGLGRRHQFSVLCVGSAFRALHNGGTRCHPRSETISTLKVPAPVPPEAACEPVFGFYAARYAKTVRRPPRASLAILEALWLLTPSDDKARIVNGGHMGASPPFQNKFFDGALLWNYA